MLKKLLSLAIAINILLPLPLSATQYNLNPELTNEQEIQALLSSHKKTYRLINANGLLILSAALALGTSVAANSHLSAKINRIIADKTLMKTNPAQALAAKANALTKSLNRTVKGKKSYLSISRDVNLLNKRLQEFADYANSFPEGTRFKHIPPDLHPEIRKTLSSIPRNLVNANPGIRKAISGIKTILRKSAERLSEKGIATAVVCIAIFAMLPEEAQSAQVSTSRIEMKRALLAAEQESPEYLTLTALALAEHNTPMVASILNESAQTGGAMLPIIEAEMAIINSPATQAAVKEFFQQQDESASAKADLIKALNDKESRFNVNFSF